MNVAEPAALPSMVKYVVSTVPSVPLRIISLSLAAASILMLPELVVRRIAASPILRLSAAIDETELAIKAHELELHIGSPVLQLSGVSRAGLTDVLRAIATKVEQRDAFEKTNKIESGEEEPGGWRP